MLVALVSGGWESRPAAEGEEEGEAFEKGQLDQFSYSSSLAVWDESTLFAAAVA